MQPSGFDGQQSAQIRRTTATGTCCLMTYCQLPSRHDPLDSQALLSACNIFHVPEHSFRCASDRDGSAILSPFLFFSIFIILSSGENLCIPCLLSPHPHSLSPCPRGPPVFPPCLKSAAQQDSLVSFVFCVMSLSLSLCAVFLAL